MSVRWRSVAIPKETLARSFADMDARELHTLRMREGGKYNVNIRRITNAETAADAAGRRMPGYRVGNRVQSQHGFPESAA